MTKCDNLFLLRKGITSIVGTNQLIFFYNPKRLFKKKERDCTYSENFKIQLLLFLLSLFTNLQKVQQDRLYRKPKQCNDRWVSRWLSLIYIMVDYQYGGGKALFRNYSNSGKFTRLLDRRNKKGVKSRQWQNRHEAAVLSKLKTLLALPRAHSLVLAE